MLLSARVPGTYRDCSLLICNKANGSRSGSELGTGSGAVLKCFHMGSENVWPPFCNNCSSWIHVRLPKRAIDAKVDGLEEGLVHVVSNGDHLSSPHGITSADCAEPRRRQSQRATRCWLPLGSASAILQEPHSVGCVRSKPQVSKLATKPIENESTESKGSLLG